MTVYGELTTAQEFRPLTDIWSNQEQATNEYQQEKVADLFDQVQDLQALVADQESLIDDQEDMILALQAALESSDELVQIGANVIKALTAPSSADAKVKNSRIRVWLSRPLSYAEKEAFETNWEDEDLRRFNDTPGFPLKWNLAPNRQHAWVEGAIGSRVLYDLVATVLETHFVNAYPKAVRTFSEYNG